MAQAFHFREFTLDQSRYLLQRGERIVRLERRPVELLLLLVERNGELVSREEISQRLWGSEVFVDVDLGINTAVRKIRTALRDDPEKPRFVETVVGKGYRFAVPVAVNGETTSSVPAALLAAPRPVLADQGVASTVVPALQRRQNANERRIKKENVIRPVSTQLAEFLWLAPIPATSDEMGFLAVKKGLLVRI